MTVTLASERRRTPTAFTDHDPIFVMGARGRVGSEVVRALRVRGLTVRAAARDPRAVRELFGNGVGAVRFDPSDPKTFAAVAGSRAVFLQRSTSGSELRLIDFMKEAHRSGVKHFVFLSEAIPPVSMRPLHRLEHELEQMEGWTTLQPSFFSQRLGDTYHRDIVDDDRLYIPAGNGRIGFVDVRDVAEVAATIFASPDLHQKRAYKLTGCEALGFHRAASYLTDVLGRSIRYEPASLAGYVRHLRRRRVPWSEIAADVAVTTRLRLGRERRLDPTLARLLGREPRSLYEYVNDYRSAWATKPG